MDAGNIPDTEGSGTGHRDDDVDLVLVTMVFDAADADELLAVLAKYVVVSRNHRGCRNIDLAASATVPGRVVVVQKWSRPRPSVPTSTPTRWSRWRRPAVGSSPQHPTSTCSSRSAPTTFAEPRGHGTSTARVRHRRGRGDRSPPPDG
ncbi:MAG: hypothetical protein U5R31_17420 [Acidimicrobiia bacterium]|nr:hypothetical protein [Acidimicrobiia bacterium]